MHTVIVGGTRGLGRELVRQFASRGHAVSAIGRRPPLDADREIPGVRHWTVDLSEDQRVLSLLDEVVSWGGLVTHLICLQRFKADGDAWSGEIATSLTATKRAIECLTDRFSNDPDRSVVLVSSIVGHFVAEGQPVGYHVAKAALATMARYYAVSLGPRGIRVNCVSPCTLVKEENREFYQTKNPALGSLFERIVPLGRMGTSADSAGVIAFLCSPAAAFVTGQEIVVDGGVSLLSQESLARKLAGL